MGGCEGVRSGPEGGKGACVIQDVHVEAVFEVVVTHKAEDVVVDVAEIVDLEDSLALKNWKVAFAYIGLNPPVPIIILENRMLVKEPTIPPTHVMIADHPSLSNSNCAQVFQTVHESALVDPVW